VNKERKMNVEIRIHQSNTKLVSDKTESLNMNRSCIINELLMELPTHRLKDGHSSPCNSLSSK